VGGIPPFISRGLGSRIFDVDGNEYIDYVGSYGPLLFGHAPEFVVKAIADAAGAGSIYGAPCEAEVEIAELVSRMMPGMEMMRFVSSGSEATTSAVRLARGATGRKLIVKCAGCFHGSVDSLLATAGSGVATLGIPETKGISRSLAAETIVVEYNDAAELKQVFDRYGDDIAAFILEPIAANMGVVLPADGYLEAAREVTREAGALLIFDEVITGFRVGASGAQGMYGVRPDLTCLGKIIGGGIPCGAYGGRRDLMEQIAPSGPVYQAGTLSGNPLAMKAGLAVLRKIDSDQSKLYDRLDSLGQRLENGIAAAFRDAGKPVQLARKGSILTAFFAQEPVTDYPSAKRTDTKAFARYFHGLLDQGVYIAPSQFEAMFISAAHSEEDIDQTLKIIGKACKG
jgi:glutamate-1-semialdehyde 2,1-aminomutase